MVTKFIANHSDLSSHKPIDFRKDTEDATTNSGDFMEAMVTPLIQMNVECNEVKVKRSVKRRNGTKYAAYGSSEEESDSDRPIKVHKFVLQLSAIEFLTLKLSHSIL